MNPTHLETRGQEEELHATMLRALRPDAEGREARERARALLGYDEWNFEYFRRLFARAVESRMSARVRLHDPDVPSVPGFREIHALATAPADLLRELSVAEYDTLLAEKESLVRASRAVALWLKKMQAGSGSSILRRKYLARLLGLPEPDVRIGSKGTDLFIPLPTAPISIAEAQVRSAMASLRRGEVGEVHYHDIVSFETEDAIRRLWSGFREVQDGFFHDGVSRQAFLPTLDELGRLTARRTAPGGHGFFAVEALRAAWRPELRPRTERSLIAAISNGEDLNSAPDGVMLGHVVIRSAPITLVTTDRMPVDAKGGILGVSREDEGTAALTVFETAQAGAVGQEALFARLPGAVSTNLTLFNYDALSPLLEKEVAEIGEDALLDVLMPDLIRNSKSQRDAEGVLRRYTQLEGTMGSVIMNLDRYWRKKHGVPLVHLIHVGRRRRTDFFTPVKSAFDFYLLYHSDHFVLDSTDWRLLNRRAGELPRVILRDPASADAYYADVQNVLDAFEGASVMELDELLVVGRVCAAGLVLKGHVELFGES